jgi:hypothetical protein
MMLAVWGAIRGLEQEWRSAVGTYGLLSVSNAISLKHPRSGTRANVP